MFDYHPEVETNTTAIRLTVGAKTDFIKVTVTELLVIIYISIYLTDEVREVNCILLANLIISNILHYMFFVFFFFVFRFW